MRTLEQLFREIEEMELINPDMEPIVGTYLLTTGNKFKVQVTVTIYDMIGKSFRERKTITIPETNRNKAELKRGEIHGKVKEILGKKYKDFQDAMYGNAKHELVAAMNEWLAYHEEMEDWAITTLETYKDKMKTIENYFGDKHIYVEDVKASDITNFSDWAIKNGRIRPKKNNDGTVSFELSHATIKDLHGMLFGFFKYAIERRSDINIQTNPCRDSSIPKKTSKKVVVDMENREKMLQQIEEDHEKWMDKEQYKLFRQWLIDNADEYKYQHFKKLIEIVEVLIFTGMRREELAGLRWRNVDLRDGSLYVVETRVRAGNKEYEVFGCKTEESVRKYKLRKDMIELFSRIADRQMQLGIYDRNNYVFVWEHDEDNHGIKAGTPYKVDYLTKLFKKAVNECPHVSSKLTLHKTRHSCCSILFSIGWSMAEVQDWLGHKDGSKITEEVYNHYRQVVAVENIDKFAETLK